MPPLAAALRSCLPSDPVPRLLSDRRQHFAATHNPLKRAGIKKAHFGTVTPGAPPDANSTFPQPSCGCVVLLLADDGCIGGVTQPPPDRAVNSIGTEAHPYVDWQMVAICGRRTQCMAYRSVPLARHAWRNFGSNRAVSLPRRGDPRNIELFPQARHCIFRSGNLIRQSRTKVRVPAAQNARPAE